MSGEIFIYSYRNGSNDGDELRYSLRSLHKNFFCRGPLDVILVGDKPSWYTGSHIPTIRHEQKYRDILKNVIIGLRQVHSERRVLYMDDDMFLMDPTDHVLLAAKGLFSEHLADAIAYHGADYEYTRFLQATADYMDAPGNLSFELHRPMPIRPNIGYELLTNIWRRTSPESMYPEIPFWRTVYGNFVNQTEELSAIARDGKIGTVSELARGEKLGVPWISGSDALWRGKLRSMITKHFPEKSPWEA